MPLHGAGSSLSRRQAGENAGRAASFRLGGGPDSCSPAFGTWAHGPISSWSLSASLVVGVHCLFLLFSLLRDSDLC